MRWILLLLRNVLASTLALLTWPLRAAGARRRPTHVRFVVKGDLPYRKAARGWRWGRREPEQVKSFSELDAELLQVEQTPWVRGVVLELEGLLLTAAKRAALLELIARVRRAGKEVIGHATHADAGTYEVLCGCSRVLLQPGGRIELNGFAAELTAIAPALRKLGVQAEFFRRGRYKTAPELFTDDAASPAQVETVEGLLSERTQRLVQQVASGRGRSAEEVRRWVNEGPYTAARALSQGLVDGLASRARWEQVLSEGGAVARITSYGGLAARLPWPPGAWRAMRRPRHRVSVVTLEGMIGAGDGARLPVGPQVAGADAVCAALRDAREDRGTQAALLYIESPGGSALHSELILDEVRRLAEKKPVVAYFERVAASGGYMVALGAQEIWAGPGALVGSIGVFGGKFEASALLDWAGVHRTLVKTGEHAALASPSRPFTDSERALLEAEVEETYQSFVAMVAAARKRTAEEIHARGEGRVFSSEAGQAEGLLDQVGSFEGACRRALALAGAQPKHFELRLHKAPRPWSGLLGMLNGLASARIYALWHPWLTLSDARPPVTGAMLVE